MQVAGSYKAGELKQVRDIEITAQSIKSYSISSEGFVEGYCCEGAELIESIELGLLLWVPGELRIVCDSFRVFQSSDREELVQPWLSTSEFFAYAARPVLPVAADWIDYLRCRGFDAVWRYYYSDAQALERVPMDYSGWFIQLRSRLSEHPQGLFFNHCEARDNRCSLSLRNFDPAIQDVWIEVGKYVATFSEIKIACGNAELDQTEWLSYLAKLSAQVQ